MLKKLFIILSIILLVTVTGCKKNDTTSSDNDKTEETVDQTKDTVEEKAYLEASTSISYSDGNQMNWSYGNQRKEFPKNEDCYVRIGSSVFTNKTFGKGEGDIITITFRFVGTKDCNVEVSDGMVKEIKNEENVTEFQFTLDVTKKKNAYESIVIFRYSPKRDADKMKLEVIYDEQIKEKYDQLSTVYFN